ncbi:MAG: hypothetical protein WC809_18860 [Sinimarinibacterium sp.]|jgi:hypothetical protein
MPPFAEDLAPFFNPNDFGVEAGYSALGSVGDPVLINGIFDNGFDASLGALEGVRPSFTCRQADVPSAAHDDELEIDGNTYVVCGVEPDGTGVMRLVLELAP